ncbi:MAG TPA: Gfo/Idh/MocA family oxidoreductase, partial [Candidatus Dormibacteraeota bacterium]|nr:Gfo/Idh/MocA family oxidoreductase [Candidatus Dormibacteraeota bacterium]
MNTPLNALTTRRDFLKTSALVGGVLAAPAILPGNLLAAGKTGTIKIGLVGCGGRGSGAASQALNADPDVELIAMGDAFEDQLQKSLQSLQKSHGEKVKVTPERSFVGLDAYQKVIDSGVDVVLLATPPGFRPTHLKAAIDAGKHVFCEKPMATDAPGVRSVMESVKVARDTKVSLVAGFCWRRDTARREFYKRIHAGAIGDIRAIYATYYTGPVKPMPAASDRGADVGDLEWQMRNWYNFVWLSGDGYVEQCCHSVDKVAWGLKDQAPLKAVAVGGRQIPNNQGTIYDHMFVVYEFPNEVRAFVGQRQTSGCYSENSDYLMGSEGVAKIPGWQAPYIKGKTNWRYHENEADKKDMYQVEHNELFASIRSGEPINDGEWMAQSTLMGIMGRMAAYSGQEITWEQALNSDDKLVPDNLDWKMKL